MTTARRRRLTTLALVAAVLTAGLIGTVDATRQVESQGITTGHSEYADATTTFNSCFAGLAGALMQRVTWFNGQTLFSRMDDGGGQKWIYVTEHLTDDGEGPNKNDGFNETTGFKVGGDPSKKTLHRTNQTYKFRDKNDPDKEWIVREYFELRMKKNTEGAGVDDPTGKVGDQEHHHHGTTRDKFYVFAVKVDDAIFDPTLNKDYNFAMVIDTCRFHTAGNTTTHDGATGDSGAAWGQHRNQSPENETHDHGEFAVDIWAGGEPQTLGVQVPDDRGNESAANDTEDGNP